MTFRPPWITPGAFAGHCGASKRQRVMENAYLQPERFHCNERDATPRCCPCARVDLLGLEMTVLLSDVLQSTSSTDERLRFEAACRCCVHAVLLRHQVPAGQKPSPVGARTRAMPPVLPGTRKHQSWDRELPKVSGNSVPASVTMHGGGIGAASTSGNQVSQDCNKLVNLGADKLSYLPSADSL